MKTTTITIPADLRAELDALVKTDRWTPEMDAILREYAGRVSHPALAELLTRRYGQVSETTVRRRIRHLGLTKNKEAR